MISNIEHQGPLWTDTSISGEGKSEGFFPAHPGWLRLSRDRWMIFGATLDPKGWDATQSILYQIRAEAPDGKILKEGKIVPCVENWDPLKRGDDFSKRCGLPIAFGVPKNATHRGEIIPHHNHFVLKYNRYAHKRIDGLLYNPETPMATPEIWPEAVNIRNTTLRMEWIQFKLNDLEDDIEYLQEAELLCEKGYGQENDLCSLGPNISMNGSMVPPTALSERADSWFCYENFQCGMAPVEYRFNPQSRLYEWIRTGKAFLPDENHDLFAQGKWIIHEPCVAKSDGAWIVLGRGRQNTHLFRIEDPFEPLTRPGRSFANFYSPRLIYTCPDNVVRYITNEDGIREKLTIRDLDPRSLELGNRKVLCDAKAMDFPLQFPAIDMPKLCAHQGKRQLLLTRIISIAHSSRESMFNETPSTAEEFDFAGIHKIEITYDRDYPDTWRFKDSEENGMLEQSKIA